MAGIGPEPDIGDDGPLEAEQELAFSDTADRLPWLESDDDDEPGGGVDTGRLVALAVVGLMAVLAVLGLVWWLTRERPSESQIAEGGTISAPAGPYKVKPADPGGRKVAGTGDTSFAVAEGREVEGHIAETPAPAPVVSAKPSPIASKAPAAGAVGVQVGAYSTKAQAEAGWTQLAGRLDPLHGRNHRVVEGVADSGTVFRLQAVTGSVAEADALCRSLKAAGGDCQVKR